ncbi:MAG: response regulator [Chloroflexi bacterium]|nr:MAG: response regulator [Chloroflexota bacterium]
MPRRLFVVEDDLMFAQRARAAALRLGVAAVGLTRADALAHVWEAGDVVLLQATLRPEQQLDLVQQLRRRQPTPRVVAVTGHLETGLRQRLKAAGATLAAHSAIDRVLARALGVSDDAPRGPG